TGGIAGCRGTEDFHRLYAVVTRQLRRPINPLTLGERGEWNHGAGAVAYVPFLHVFRTHASARLALYVNLLHPTTVDEVVDVATAQGNRQGAVDVGDGNAQGAGLLVIDFQLVLRFVVQTVRADLRQHLA